jgi:hypothetical protein
MAKLAFFTFGILRETEDHPQTQGFFNLANRNFAAAEQSGGFIDRSGYDDEIGHSNWGNQVSSRFFRADGLGTVAQTLSLWEDLESVFAFAYAGVHAKALSRRKEWFFKPEWPTYVAWWVADDHTPDWREAAARHEYLHDHGSSPYAFDFKRSFDPDGSPADIDRAFAKIIIGSNESGSRFV